jgi:hypothetical protein
LRFEDDRRGVTFLTATPSQGECRIGPEPWLAKCVIGAIKNNEMVTVSLEAKVKEFGGENFSSFISRRPLAPFANSSAPAENAAPSEPPPDIPQGEVMEVNISGRAGEDDTIPVAFESVDTRGVHVAEDFELLVDGKRENEVYNSLSETWGTDIDATGNTVTTIVSTPSVYRLTGLLKGAHTLQIIAKENMGGPDSVILGRSQIINILIK